MSEAMKQKSMPEDTSEYEKIIKEYKEFAYVVSHDLEAPVRQLKGLTDMILKEMNSELSPQQESYKEMINDVAVEAMKTLDALLVFSRLNTDEKNFEEVNLNELVSDVLGKFNARITSSECEVSVEEMPTVYGDYNLLVQTFYHLIDNAVKFQPVGQNPIVNIGIDQKDGKNIFTVTDNGIGIDPQKIDPAFVILRRLNPPNAYEGRGSGLTFAKKIVEIHGGNIWIDSKPGEGTKVLFTLNLKAGDEFKNFKPVK